MKNSFKFYFFCAITTLLFQTTFADESSKGLFDFYTNKAKTVATTIEVKNIAQMIYLDYISGIEIPSPGIFSDYVRKHNRAPYGHDRDTAFDFWNNLYILKKDDIGFKVISMGPDESLHTEDDIVYGFYLE